MLYMNNKKNDLKFGLSKEQEILPLLEEHFGKLNKLPPNDEFDFINDTYVVEVKSRRISIDTYPSQMVGMNKLNVGLIHQQNNLTPVFIFNCRDGAYCWIQDNNYSVRIGGRNDRGRPEYKQYAYVKTEFLNLLFSKSNPPPHRSPCISPPTSPQHSQSVKKQGQY